MASIVCSVTGSLDAEVLLLAQRDEVPVEVALDGLEVVVVEQRHLGLHGGRAHHRLHHHGQVLGELLAC